MNTGSDQAADSKLNSQESKQDKTQFEQHADRAIDQTDRLPQGEQAVDNSPPNLQSSGAETPGQKSGNRLTPENLPQDAQNSLPEEAQHLFIAAYNSILDNNGDEQTAARVAWQTIENNEHYERGSDGKWQRIADNADKRGGDRTMIHETAP